MIHTLAIILEQSLLYFPLVLGSYISISLLRVPDLSIEVAYVCGAIMGAKMQLILMGQGSFITFVLVLLASIFGGMLVGSMSSCLTLFARFPHLLSSILTLGLFHGINQFVMGSAHCSISQCPSLLEGLPLFSTHPEIVTLLIFFLVIALLGLVLFKTELGVAYAVHGNNPHFFGHYGISARFIFMSGLLLSNGLAGLTGLLVAQSNGFVDLRMGVGLPLLCVTALILGKTIARIQVPISFIMPLLGVCSYFTLQQLLLKGGFDLKYFTMVQSGIVLCALLISFQKSQRLGQKPSIDHLGV